MVRIAIFFACLTVVAGSLTTCEEPDFTLLGTPLVPAAEALPQPVFRVPVVDRCNPLLAVFVDVDVPAQPEFNVVWKDEDFPIPLVDELYDAERWSGYFRLTFSFPFVGFDMGSGGFNRRADIEAFAYQLDEAGDVVAIVFAHTYSAGQTWNVLRVRHRSAVVPIEAFEMVDGRPVIYVNTWNHMFSNENTNPGLELIEHSAARTFSGSRGEVEGFYQAVRNGKASP